MSRADQDPREYSHIECDCVPNLGPSHCHLCETEWPCADRMARTNQGENNGR